MTRVLDFSSDNMVDESLPIDSPMASFYRDKTVFITGGTGFLGQLFIEKLLRCKVKEIYVLARPKKNKTAAERIQETFSGAVFAKLKSVDPNYKTKIKLVEGDTAKADLGISDGDRQNIVDRIEIVIHAAADVRFDKPLQELCFTNVRGTKALVSLVEGIKNLVVFAYISTAYSQYLRERIEEKFYPPAIDPDEMIRIAEYFHETQTEELELLTEKFIHPWKNTYVFSKSLAEEVVRRSVNKIPTVIIRPSVIISTHKDPIPGWTNNVYGLNGLALGGGMGVIKVVNFDSNNEFNIVCADYVTNGTLAAIWDKSNDKKTTRLNEESKIIYHITSHKDTPNRDLFDASAKFIDKIPSVNAMWLQSFTFVRSRLLFNILCILYHLVPACALDIFFKLTKNKLRLMPFARKIQDFLKRINNFDTKFNFDRKNMETVIEKMSEEDAKFFQCDLSKFKLVDFIYDYLLGIRTYIAKEPLDNYVEAKKRLRLLRLVYYPISILYHTFLVCLLYVFLRLIGVTSSLQILYNNFLTLWQNLK